MSLVTSYKGQEGGSYESGSVSIQDLGVQQRKQRERVCPTFF